MESTPFKFTLVNLYTPGDIPAEITWWGVGLTWVDDAADILNKGYVLTHPGQGFSRIKSVDRTQCVDYALTMIGKISTV